MDKNILKMADCDLIESFLGEDVAVKRSIVDENRLCDAIIDPFTNDDIKEFTRSISDIPRLSDAEMSRLLYIIHSDAEKSHEAREELINVNLYRVLRIARRYMGQGLSLPDLIQEGCIGVMMSIENFDINRIDDSKFSSYTTWYIHSQMKRAIYKYNHIYTAYNRYEKINTLINSIYGLSQELGRYPTVEELSNDTDIPTKKIYMLLTWTNGNILSTDELCENGYCVDKLVDEEDVNIVNIDYPLLKSRVQDILSTLSPRHTTVIELRFGLNGNTPHTLDYIAETLSVSRNMIREIEARALRAMRHPIYTKILRDFR